MLVLTRKTEEAIRLLNGTIRIVVLEVHGDQVRLGIDAPRSVDVLREEIWLSQLENQRAAETADPAQLDRLTPPKAPPSPRSKPKSP
ncbi:MAG: carbon storage regulator [Firmicutes bacterium]|nr:carbon storage regulator [Alicyclobacillaceae bacterium]MCL6497317.1 carbon storage regulator [Bacillota bacterium]